ncbi:single-stranded DNA-binding protein [Candidatus Sumerlaeota bacterium]|nr:single-stranded DNA-binding protein [Candidatus Sumerlaeota bacterium]
MDLNRVLMIGNLTRDPESRSTNTGLNVTKFSIAVNDRRSGKDSETTMFIRVEAWGKTGDLVAQYMTKGSQVLVEGRLKIDEYKAKDGTDRKEPVIVADRVSFGAKPRGGEGGGGSYGGGSSSGGGRTQPSLQKRDAAPAEDDRGHEGGGTDDDLPF